jgi:hypothetical protein
MTGDHVVASATYRLARRLIALEHHAADLAELVTLYTRQHDRQAPPNFRPCPCDLCPPPRELTDPTKGA